MALTICHECTAQISADTENCPKCGARQRRTPTSVRVVGVLCALFALGWIVNALHAPAGNPTQGEQRQEQTAATKAAVAEQEDAYQQRMAEKKRERQETFARDRKKIIGNIQALSRAGKWYEARVAANEYHGDVEDAELDRLYKTADEKYSAKQAAEIKASKRKEGVSIGMTKQVVLDSKWGRPQHINRTVTARGTREQWVYGGRNYLYFDGDTLTSIQN